ncbi:hypothetical protein H6P81_007128 [Aristolochia fimbriata]|uniref:Gnk2-homologous domain-containing protein n=1 Tax=Aristolochia fimbriata TaxID=158543 RepID=A0AAV7F0K5_ARIFI|nr:hypothetical protein H6P81_007128 [Aristolochia fimbriata]
MSESNRFVVSACFLFFFFSSFMPLGGKAQEEEKLTLRPANSDNYTSGSQYETNLKILLTSLTLNAIRNIDTYYNTIVGRGSDQIYGYAQCMSAATAGDCSVCLDNSLTDMNQLCPKKKRATVRYYSCIIRYSDQNFFSKSVDTIVVNFVNTANATEPALFNRQLSSLMKNLSEEGARNASRLAWGRTSYTDFPRADLYGVAQCTRYLPPNAWSDCLSQTVSHIPTCCDSKIGAQIYLPTCSIRYEIRPFDPASRLPPPVPPAPPGSAASPSSPPSSGSNGGGSNERRTVIVAISVVSVASVAGISIILCICLSRRKKQWNNIPVDGDKDEMRNSESLLFDIKTLRAATDNFSDANKLGHLQGDTTGWTGDSSKKAPYMF